MTPRFATLGDEELLRSIVTHPSVRKHTECDGAREFDPTAYTAHPKSRAILVEGGCWLLAALEQDAYGVHTCLLPECRGARAVAAAEMALEFTFVRTDATQLWTSVPENNRAALWFAHKMGFRDEYTRPGAWMQGGRAWAMTYLRLDIDRWVQGSERLREAGEWFHAQREAGGHAASHACDAMHDRYVGAAGALIVNGQIAKARHVYNRWARACGYQPFEVLDTDPVRLSIGDATVAMTEQGLIFEELAHA